MPKKIPCCICSGHGVDPSKSGYIGRDMPCSYCNGTGKVDDPEGQMQFVRDDEVVVRREEGMKMNNHAPCGPTGLPDETSPLILYDPILGEQLGTDCYVPVRVIRMRPGISRETMKTVWGLIFRFKDAWKELAK